jgi:hypothetical protein
MKNLFICWFFTDIFTGILICKGLTARRFYKSFGVKRLNSALSTASFSVRLHVFLSNKRKTALQNHVKFDTERISNMWLLQSRLCWFKVKENEYKSLFSFWCAFEKFQKSNISFVIFVRSSAWNNSAPAGRIFMKFGMSFFPKICREESCFIEVW